MQLSEVIAQTKKFFRNVTGEEKVINVSPELIEHKLEDHHFSREKKEVQEFLKHMDYDKKGYTSFHWKKILTSHYFLCKNGRNSDEF